MTHDDHTTTSHDDSYALSAVDLDAVAAILAKENLEYVQEDDYVRTGFANTAIVIAVDGATLIFEALWRGEFPREMASHVLFACNEYNQTHFTPTLRFLERGEEHLAVSAVRTLDITHGASFNQLGAFLVSTISATMEAFDFLATTFPTIVTWEEPSND